MKRLTSVFGTHWQQLGCNQHSDSFYVRGLRPLWMDMQSAFNETCRNFFIEGFTPYMHIINGDDKMHCEVNNKTDTQGLQNCNMLETTAEKAL
jgi:hypothetical protein